jgi:hypothetical protein
MGIMTEMISRHNPGRSETSTRTSVTMAGCSPPLSLGFGVRPNKLILFPSPNSEYEGVHYTPRGRCCSASLKQRIFVVFTLVRRKLVWNKRSGREHEARR